MITLKARGRGLKEARSIVAGEHSARKASGLANRNERPHREGRPARSRGPRRMLRADFQSETEAPSWGRNRHKGATQPISSRQRHASEQRCCSCRRLSWFLKRVQKGPRAEGHGKLLCSPASLQTGDLSRTGAFECLQQHSAGHRDFRPAGAEAAGNSRLPTWLRRSHMRT